MKCAFRVKPPGWIGFLCRGFSIPQNFGKSFMDNERRFYTYAYLREDRTPYYIGKGHGKRAYRKGKHEINPPKDKSRVIFLKRSLTEEEAFRHEVYMIAVFGRKDLGTGILRNKTDGGEGSSNFSKEAREKISKNWQNMSEGSRQKHKEKLRGRKLSLEHRQRIGQANIGRKLSQSSRDKIGAAHRGKKESEETRRKKSDSHEKKVELTRISDGAVFFFLTA